MLQRVLSVRSVVALKIINEIALKKPLVLSGGRCLLPLVNAMMYQDD